jgi:hypothetical protein
MNKVINIFLSSLLVLLSFWDLPAYCYSNKAVDDSGVLVSNWLRLQQRLIRSSRGISHPEYSRHSAYTGIAVYESIVNSNPHYNTLAGQLQGLQSLPTPSKNVQ